MDMQLPKEVVDFTAVARKTLQAAGLRLARESGTSGDVRTATNLLDGLGWKEFDVIGDPDEALAAAHLMVEIGRAALPVPAAATIVGACLGAGKPVHAIGGPANTAVRSEVLVDYLRQERNQALLSRDGFLRGVNAVASAGELRPLAPYADFAELAADVEDLGELGVLAWSWHEVLSAFSSLGAIEHAADQSKRYLNERYQFGKPLRARQALEHRFVDVVVQQSRLRELALFTAWSLSAKVGDPVAAALALRMVHLEAVRDVFRNVHQIHGAIGFCFENDVAMLSRFVQFRRYQPFTYRETLSELGHYVDDIPSLFVPESNLVD